ncbi:MAG: YncE family protein [Maioricimonas sp. JB049]
MSTTELMDLSATGHPAERFCGATGRTAGLILAITLLVAGCSAKPEPEAQPENLVETPSERPARRITRLFWQDREDDSLKWADLKRGDGWQLQPAVVEGFPSLDVAKQDLVQMAIIDRTLLVGVRDEEDGQFQSGWVAVETGVVEIPHGDHSHWKYLSEPRVSEKRLDRKQGNPAHLYVYDNAFWLANDQLDGFTRFEIGSEDGQPLQSQFFLGGGNHITLAAVDGVVGYSTWIDGGGPNAGRVDVVNLRSGPNGKPAYSFTLPSGVVHGATVNSGRVYFAPAEGVCRVEADLNLKESSETVRVHQISLGTDEETDKPLRTGAFTNHRNWVLFSTGTADSSALGLFDAEAPTEQVVKVAIDVADGLSLVTPKVIRTRGGKRYAFLFQDRKEGDVQEKLTIVDLDPNGDRDFSDAQLAKTLSVGASRVEGHFGHHDICFSPNGKYAVVTNPGDGTIQVLSLEDLEIEATLQVGGNPSAIISTGG